MKPLNILRAFLATNFLLLTVLPAESAVVNAVSGSFADVSTAVAQAQPGDTVLIPPGTNIWTGALQISGITLRGSGTNQTVIVDETPPVGNGTPLIHMTTTATLTRVTQLQMLLGVTNTFPYQNYNGSIMVDGNSPLFRIDHCLFAWLTSKPIHVDSGEYGLIDHCIFMMTNSANAIEVNGAAFGDVSWATPDTFGTSNALFMEDNYLFSANNFCAVDVANGGRAVFRHNTLIGAFFGTHGSETGQRYRSVRQVEVYNNNFSWGGGQQYNNFYTACDIRGGTGVIFSNTAVGYWAIGSLNCYRATDNDTGFIPWFGATGERLWDSNGPVLLSGTASVTSNALVIAGANWTSNQWYGCTVYNINDQLCGVVSGNSSNKMQFAASRSSWLQISFNKGDSFQIHNIYPMLDQPGIGQGALLSPNNGGPSPVYLNQAPDPIYVWGNSLACMYATATAIAPTAWSTFPTLKQNRDYFNGVVKPGYIPFVYPHPFTLLDSLTTTNSASPMAPPTLLNAGPPGA